MENWISLIVLPWIRDDVFNVFYAFKMSAFVLPSLIEISVLTAMF